MSKVDLSVILACYNEGPTFAASVGKIIRELRKLRKEWEIIFIEDKSVDGTGELVKKLVKATKNSRALFHKKNLGRGKSVTDGIIAARGEICGYLDVDLEISEKYIGIFVAEIEKGADLVVGRRFYEGGLAAISRFLASKIYANLVKRLLKLPVTDTEAGYKFFKREKILPLLKKTSAKHWFWDTEICARAYWANLAISEIPVLFARRGDKKSTVRLIPDTLAYLKSLTTLRNQIPKAFR